LANLAVDRLRVRHVEVLEIVGDGGRIESHIEARQRQKRFQLGAERERGRRRVVIERFLAEAIPSDEEPLAPLVPYAESEHAVQARQAPFAPLLVRVDDDLRIRTSTEAVPQPQQLLSQ